MSKYRTHSFNKQWHDKVEEFIEENDLAFDSPKYFIKYCVNRFMEQYGSSKGADLEYWEAMWDKITEEDIDVDKDALRRTIAETDKELNE